MIIGSLEYSFEIRRLIIHDTQKRMSLENLGNSRFFYRFSGIFPSSSPEQSRLHGWRFLPQKLDSAWNVLQAISPTTHHCLKFILLNFVNPRILLKLQTLTLPAAAEHEREEKTKILNNDVKLQQVDWISIRM